MDKTSAQNLIKDTFNYPFNEEKFSKFSVNLLEQIKTNSSSVWLNNTNLPLSFRENVKQYKIFGHMEYKNGDKIIVAMVDLKSSNVVEKSRYYQRNFSKWLLEKHNADACLISFFAEKYDDWRFSLVKLQFKREQSDKGKLIIKKEITPIKRYSYLVGENEPNHTAQSQLSPLLLLDKDPSIADLVKAFSVDKVNEDFFDAYRKLCFKFSNELEKLVKKDKKIKQAFNKKNVRCINFAKKFMGQIIFIYFLQKKGLMGITRNSDGNYNKWGTGPKNFLKLLFEKKYCKYNNFFNDILEPLFYIALNTETGYYPKLNCRVPFLNGGLFEPINDYNWEETDIKISDNLIGEIFYIFDQYNFTVNEEDPIEKEVAINPEMLGHIFESLINENLRRATGTFYTPGHIVSHMSKNSIFYYLKNCLKDKIKNNKNFENNLRTFIENYHLDSEDMSLRKVVPKTILDNKHKILDIFQSIKILDPAVGSGAFLVTMLQILTNLSLLLIENNKKDLKYDYKRKIIQNNLHGVDIDESAIEIAKLRLWLSLIVEEKETEIIEPLPNLDYNVVNGDSLAEVPHNFNTFTETDELEKLKKEYSNITSIKKKREQKIIISHLEEKLFSKNSFDIKLKFYEIFNTNDGFDIVIGNPPYDVYHQEKKSQIKFFRESRTFESALGGKLNAYKLFLAKSVTLLKNNGILTKIFQNSFTADKTAKDLRNYFLTNTTILKLDSFPERDNVHKRVFKSAKMSVCIMSILNKKNENNKFEINTHTDKTLENFKKLEIFQKDPYKIDSLNFIFPTGVNSNEVKLYMKIKENNFPTLYPHYGKSYDGEVSLTFDKKFLSPNKLKGYYPMLKGAAIQKWFIAKKMSQGITEYLNLSKYKEKNKGEKTNHYTNKRVVIQGMTGVGDKVRVKATMCPKNIFLGNSVNYAIVDNNKIHDEILVCILNSKVINWFFKFSSTNSNVNGYEINNFPIPKIGDKDQKKLKKIYEEINLIDFNSRLNENQKSNLINLEKKLNNEIYNLYNLSSSDIDLIESS